jgi:acyl-CoA synthetase (NDP forming)
VHDVEQAQEAAAALGGRVVMKVVSAAALHKSDGGGVRLGVAGPAAVQEAFEAMAAAWPGRDGVFVQAHARDGGTEVLLGVTQDPVFGPLIAFGLGGIHVEVLRDVVFRVTPLETGDARDMVRGIRGHALLEGHRGAPPRDREALVDALLRLARLAEALPELAELDLNPVFALADGEGCQVADVRLRLQ